MDIDFFYGPVAYIDLLGFSDYIRKNERDKIGERVGGFAEAVRQATALVTLPVEPGVRDKPLSVNFDYAIFSDSLVLYQWMYGYTINWKRGMQVRHEWGALKEMLSVCSRLSFLLLQMGQPFRGCITRGEYCAHKDPEGRGIIVAGKPVIEAYELEGRQDWIGIVLHKDAYKEQDTEEQLSQRARSHAKQTLSVGWDYLWPHIVDWCDKVPVSSKRGIADHKEQGFYAVVPSRKDDGTVGQAIESIQQAREALLLARDSSQGALRKYDATEEWYKKIEDELVSSRKQRTTEWP